MYNLPILKSVKSASEKKSAGGTRQNLIKSHSVCAFARVDPRVHPVLGEKVAASEIVVLQLCVLSYMQVQCYLPFHRLNGLKTLTNDPANTAVRCLN